MKIGTSVRKQITIRRRVRPAEQMAGKPSKTTAGKPRLSRASLDMIRQAM